MYCNLSKQSILWKISLFLNIGFSKLFQFVNVLTFALYIGTCRTKKDHPFLSGLCKFLDEEGLECEYELSARLFFRILAVAVAVFEFRSEGLHNLELSVLGEGVVNTGAPGFDVIHLTESPGVGGTADECTVFSVDVFNQASHVFGVAMTALP